ncbi:MAG: hypothetical protein DESF_02577 [Desulfovibrio sp.]
MDDGDSELPVSVNQLSNVWDMEKDGRRYWPLSKEKKTARRCARKIGRGRKERKALEARLLHKFMGK